MKAFLFAANLCRIFICLAVLFGLAQTEVSAATKNNKSKSFKTKKKQARLWEKTGESDLAARGQRLLTPQKYVVFRLNQTALSDVLDRMPLEFTDAARQQIVAMEVPMPDGTLARFRIRESPVLAPRVAAELPGVKTFSGQGIDDPTAVARFDWTPLKGFHGYILSQNGTIYIDPYLENDREYYVVYYKHEYGVSMNRFYCKLHENPDLNLAEKESPLQSADFSSGADLRTYRIAIAGTGNYTTNRGGQAGALAAVTTAVNRLTGIFRRDAAISFTLVSGTNTLFPDPNTDPYNNTSNASQLTANQTQLDTIIGNANYDVGHLFITGFGGVAFTPSVCDTNFKAGGISGLANPTGDEFVVDVVAHELGHQFNARHSYNNSGDSGCNTRDAANAYEPAGGATIMSYAGACDPSNLQDHSMDLFTVQSLAQVIDWRDQNPPDVGCGGTLGASGNTPPVIGALANFTIPRNTPFALTATATDANDPANQLTYSWEENDLGAQSGTTSSPDSDADGMARPIFRIFQPTNAGATRNFPSLTYILNNANVPPPTYSDTSPTGNVCDDFASCITGEILPSIGRVMSFRVTARDNNATTGGAADAGMTVTVDGATGPFQVSVQNTFLPVTWQGNTMQTVTWDVNGSNAHAANVKISLSSNGGTTFPITILASTPNDGTQTINVPNTPTTAARIKVEAVGNIFFDINNVNFTITAATAASANVGGRVLSPDGRGIARARVTLTGQSGSGRTAITNPFGYYGFENVEVGQTYIVDVRHKWYQFVPQSVVVFDNIVDLNFIAQP